MHKDPIAENMCVNVGNVSVPNRRNSVNPVSEVTLGCGGGFGVVIAGGICKMGV